MITIILLLILPIVISAIWCITKMPETKTSVRRPKSPTITPISKVPTSKKSLFIKDTSLMEFKKEYGSKMQVGTFTKDGKTLHACKFIKEDGTETRVFFFSQLGVLTPKEIKDRKDKLWVGQMKSGKYYLHDENAERWEEVDLDQL